MAGRRPSTWCVRLRPVPTRPATTRAGRRFSTGLIRWPDPTAAEELAKLAANVSDGELKSRAVRAFLESARQIHSLAAVKFAAESLGEPKLAGQACATIVDLLHHDEIRNSNKAETDKLLDRVIATSKDKSLVERAWGFKSAK